MRKLNQTGFGHVILLVALVALAVVGFAGYRVWTSQNTATAPDSSQAATLPATIETKADLAQTGKMLDETSAQLDTNLDDGGLDADINSML